MIDLLVGKNLDLVVASRFTDGGREIGLSSMRKLYSRGAMYYFKLFFPIKDLNDYSSGYRAYNMKTLRNAYEKWNGVHFDYLFLASGTGTTQAGLVCASLMKNDARNIIGISIARPQKRGQEIVIDSIREYLAAFAPEKNDEVRIRKAVRFLDDYTSGGYGLSDDAIEVTIRAALKNYGIPFDHTYTGKAFEGMKEYIEVKYIEDSNILFLHTGGTPLFFDDLVTLHI
jgi:1-aminocyclopropane-1-carboxylate deaminase/D-cysteine desulfhydrase-like pyridoxal-dependent ACC family enzyme